MENRNYQIERLGEIFPLQEANPPHQLSLGKNYAQSNERRACNMQAFPTSVSRSGNEGSSVEIVQIIF